LCASITALTVFANCCIETEYAEQVVSRFAHGVAEACQLLNKEGQPILKLRQQCLAAWKKLDLYIQEIKAKQPFAGSATVKSAGAIGGKGP